MKYLAVLFCVLTSLHAQTVEKDPAKSPSQNIPPYKNADLPIDERVEDLLGRMTLEEKVAQTHAIWKHKADIEDASGTFDAAKAAGTLKDGIGQITRPGEGKSPREAVEFANAAQHWVLANTRLGIPVMFHEECLHGLAESGATSYPVPMALASTWDPALVEQIFTAVAREARARGAQQCLAPVVDLAREPRWGRTEETYGEDPYLVSRMGVAAVFGYQGHEGNLVDGDHVIATLKHFAAHGQPEAGTNVGPTSLPERLLRDTMLVPFRAAVMEAHAHALMPSYTEIDGVPAHRNKWLLDTVLRKEWGFDGIIVSDYEGIQQLKTLHHVAADFAQAARLALAAGVDLELPDVKAYGTLAEQVRSGAIPQAELDDAVRHILKAKFRTGLFEHPYVDEARIESETNNAADKQLALEAAHRAIILLKNQGDLLPLDVSKIKTLAVIGPNAGTAHLGGYSDPKQTGTSILDGIKEKVGSRIQVKYAEGARITENPPVWGSDTVLPADPKLDEQRIVEAVKVAKSADVALVVVGENEATSREAWSETHMGDRDSLDLLGRQTEMVQQIVATGKPVIVLHLGGRPNSIVWIADNVPAILEGWYLGQAAGPAVADVLFGDVAPGGKLPITVPRGVGQLPDYYNQKPSAHRGYLFSINHPLFPFGYGLSYTTFSIGAPTLSSSTMAPDGNTDMTVEVTNTGKREGDEVVQMYIHQDVSSVTRPVKELKGFRRIHLKPGETQKVTLPITADSLAFTNIDMKRVVEPGTFQIMVGANSVDLKSVQLRVQ